MCFWGCFLYKKFGKSDMTGLAGDVSGGNSILYFIIVHHTCQAEIPLHALYFINAGFLVNSRDVN